MKLNIIQKEVVPFLLATVALGLGAQTSFSALPMVGLYIDIIMANLVTFVAPAAVIVALKVVYDIARKG